MADCVSIIVGVTIGVLVLVDICEPLKDDVVDPVSLSVLDVLTELLSKALLEITPELVIIEDSERGLLAAQSANCDALWVKTYLTENFNSTAPYLGKITHGELLGILNSIA